MIKRLLLVCIVIMVGVLMVVEGFAQAQKHDTTYFETFPDQITGRFYFSHKYLSFRHRNRTEEFSFRYQPNSTINMGVGATYKWATLNLAYGFGFLNPDRGRGDTRYLDLQFHGYGGKHNVDFLGQYYEGFYLSPRGLAAGSQDPYYVRPDVEVFTLGVSYQYVVNHREFSFPAAFLQNQWQKKSAGTILIGAETFSGRIRSDSSIVPTAVNSDLAATNERKTTFFDISPTIGYAYTFVYNEGLFATVAASAGFGFSTNTYDDVSGSTRTGGFSPNTLIRLVLGYNSSKYAVILSLVDSGINLARRPNDTQLSLNAGNVRLNFVYRFKPTGRVERLLEIIE